MSDLSDYKRWTRCEEPCRGCAKLQQRAEALERKNAEWRVGIDQLEGEIAALLAALAVARETLLESALWLESRPAFDEGDAATSSSCRHALATIDAALEGAPASP